jgi:hypothetical protein
MPRRSPDPGVEPIGVFDAPPRLSISNPTFILNSDSPLNSNLWHQSLSPVLRQPERKFAKGLDSSSMRHAVARFVSRGSGSFTKFSDQQPFGHDDALVLSMFPARSDATIRICRCWFPPIGDPRISNTVSTSGDDAKDHGHISSVCSFHSKAVSHLIGPRTSNGCPFEAQPLRSGHARPVFAPF